MGQLNINVVTVAIGLVLLMYLIRGITRKFSPNIMFFSIINLINSVFFIISLGVSIYVTRRIFIDQDDGSIYKGILHILPKGVAEYFAKGGIMTYVIVVPLIFLILFFLLQYARSFIDGFIKTFSGFICSAAEKGGRVLKAVIGILIELPKAVVMVVVIVLMIGFLNIYYPENKISEDAEKSSVYNFFYTYTASPIINSELGQKIPVFFWSSVQEISDDIYGNNKTSALSNKLQEIGFLRFQLESKSNDSIDKKAKEIVGNETDSRKKAYLLYKWIGENIKYDWDKFNDVVNNTSYKDSFGAIPAFETRKGVCEDYSDLYAAMARAVGLKVRIDIGNAYSGGVYVGHAWNEVYIPDENVWIPLDTTWASSGNYFDNKDFYKLHSFQAVAGEW
jgi:hypothetical protein